MKKITKELIEWYLENKRDLPWRHTKNPYYIWISEIMLQQTRVEAVKEYYIRFIDKLPTLKDLAEATDDTLLKLWEGLGYYSRVRNMQKAAKILVGMGKENLPDTLEELLALPGIGKYTAGAILSIAYNKPSIAIDGNVYRVLGRYYAIEEDISKNSTYSVYASMVEDILPKTNAGDFTQSFMDLGSMVCTPKSPKCRECPLYKDCRARILNKMEMFPVKEKKKEQRIEERTIFLYVYQDKVAIQKRDANGLLASMYEFPNILGTPSLIDVENDLLQSGVSFQSALEVGKSKHVFSHIIWYMRGYLIRLHEPLDKYIWATKEELMEKYSIPSAFSYYYDFLMKQ